MRKSTRLKLRILLDANISHTIIPKLKKYFSFDIVHISDLKVGSISDNEIIGIAKRENRIILTHNLDYGEIYYLSERDRIGIIMLRLDDQTTDHVVEKLVDVFVSDMAQTVIFSKSLVIISENKVRIIKSSN